MSQITLETAGRRVYFCGNTYAAKGRIKAIGGHWDDDRKQWWVGSGKLADAQAVAGGVPAESVAAAKELGWPADAFPGAVADRVEEAGDVERAAAIRAAAEPKPEDLSDARVYAAVTYKGRRYYVVAEQRDKATGQPLRCRLTTLDGATPFWADCSACELVRTYGGREQWDGRHYSGRTVTVYPTVGSLRDFRDRQKNPETARVQCHECGSWHDATAQCRDCGGC